jgi:hypothetical protein
MIPDFKTAEERSQWIIDHAELWTAVQFSGRGHYHRLEFKDRKSAETAAKRLYSQNPRRPVMIYACADDHDTFVTAIQENT